MTWVEEAAVCFTADPLHLNVCEAGHLRHERLAVDVALSGFNELVPDFPPIPEGLDSEFPLAVYDWQKYEGTKGYCPGNDVVSQSIDIQGIWEGFETVLALAILEAGHRDSAIVDLGSHVGWYTMLAASFGYEVLAVDGDEENLSLLRQSVRWSNIYAAVTTAHGWVGKNTPPLPVGPHIRLLKADIEGLENEAVRVCEPLLAEGAVDYAFFEISPEFSGHYAETVRKVLNYGYRAYLIPDKGTPVDSFSQDPLGYTCKGPSLQPADVQGFTTQQNIVFVHQDA